MRQARRYHHVPGRTHDEPEASPSVPGRSAPIAIDSVVRAVGRVGLQGPAHDLPHRDTIQASFGKHDLSGLCAVTGVGAANAIGAEAYALGDRVGFASTSPSLRTAAHEAAHHVQSRPGVGVGRASDADERHADAVADAVVAGRSAEALLGPARGGGGRGDFLQRTPIGGHDSSDPGQQVAIENYLKHPNRSYDELIQIRAQVQQDHELGWSTGRSSSTA